MVEVVDDRTSRFEDAGGAEIASFPRNLPLFASVLGGAKYPARYGVDAIALDRPGDYPVG